ncbi:MAG: ribonuclease P protein component [Candidatus Sumerlaeaceae bacterium]|nr:ribonuclease P protein component [Candidatus Sumerlaeaceae bacterium]
MTDTRRYRFEKANRLLKRSEFLETYEQGQRFRRSAGQVFVVKRPDPTLPTRLGITVTRKVGGAVVRNRLKRQGREIFRLTLPQLRAGFTLVVNFHQAATTMDFWQIQRQLHSIWQEAGLFADDNRTPH